MARTLQEVNKRLKWFEKDDYKWAYFEDFFKLLLESESSPEVPRFLRWKDNVLRELNGYSQGTKMINGKKAVKSTVIFRYLFKHYDKSTLAHIVCNHLVNNVTNVPKDDIANHNGTTLDLYHCIQKIETKVMHSSCVDFEIPICITYVHSEYKEYFSLPAWTKILLFESHFQQSHGDLSKLGFDTILEKKWLFLDYLLQLMETADKIHSDCLLSIKQNLNRKSVGKAMDGILLNIGGMVHTPKCIEEDIMAVMKGCTIQCVQNVVSVNCHDILCKHEHGLHVFIEVSDEFHITELDDIATLIQSEVSKYHGTYVTEFVFLREGTFTNYSSDQGIHRFHLFDDIYQKKLGDDIQHILSTLPGVDACVNVDGIPSSVGLLCTHCFEKTSKWIGEPMRKTEFSIFKEWLLHVPLSLQIIMERAFLSKDTQIDAPTNILENRLFRLFNLVEVIMNTLNRKYFGVTHDMNTEELLVNHHSVSNVFKITSQIGLTRGIQSAENELKKKSDKELCYYNTYIRRFPLSYQTIVSDDISINLVNLRDCHIIYFVDNLVRLITRSDPEPGQCKTSQIATLPITLKGLPKDHAITLSWHDENCDGRKDCSCKDKVKLTKDDYRSVFIEPTQTEQNMITKFENEATWGIHKLWNHVAGDSDLQSIVQRAVWFCRVDDLHPSSVNKDGQSDQSHNADKENDDCCDQANISAVNEDDPISSHVAAGHTGTDKDGDGAMSLLHSDLPLHVEEDLNVTMTSLTLDDFFLDDVEEANQSVAALTLDSSSDNDAEESSEPLDGFFPLDFTDDDENDDELSKSPDPQHTLEVESLRTCFSDLSANESTNGHSFSSIDKYEVPSLLCRHPPPSSGRDSDKRKLAELLDDCLVKSGAIHLSKPTSKDRILFAPDHKISSNLLELMSENSKYQVLLPEFPLLHMRKSKMANISSAYKEAGLSEILMYMTNDEESKDLAKMLRLDNIEGAAKIIRRVSMTLHLAIMVKFLEYLPPLMASKLCLDLQSVSHIDPLVERWGSHYSTFLTFAMENNAIFALHAEIMAHCDEVTALAAAERLGGPSGYHLVLGMVKRSLPFSFLNGALAYAPFCVHLLHEHYGAGVFHQNLKMCLFATPHRGSESNFALDTQREIDHKDALKGFRPGSTLSSVLPRMSVVDSLAETSDVRSKFINHRKNKSSALVDDMSVYVSKAVSATDVLFVMPTVKMIMREGILRTNSSSVVRNMYHPQLLCLPETILDYKTEEAGRHLILRYAAKQHFCQLDKEDIPPVKSVKGPSALLKKLSSNTMGNTIKRNSIRAVDSDKPELEKAEEKRLKLVSRQVKVVNALSSSDNACQAVIKPNKSKATVNKSAGVKKALVTLLGSSYKLKIDAAGPMPANESSQMMRELLSDDDLVYFETSNIPENVLKNASHSIIEFAGVKFKGKLVTGQKYLSMVEHKIRRLLQTLPELQRIIICEEKYHFTPDDFKAATRAKRKTVDSKSIHHLKHGGDILSLGTLNKRAITSTTEGKELVSSFLAQYVQTLNIKHNCQLDIDSEYILKQCTCLQEQCSCEIYATPVRALFDKSVGFKSLELLEHIKQRKGEAELSQLDWLTDIKDELADGNCVFNIVTSGDIDTVVLHLWMVPTLWPRDKDGNFKWPIFLALEKPVQRSTSTVCNKPMGPIYDIYNVTGIIVKLERLFSQVDITTKLAVGLCIGGNDFLPHFSGISHSKMISMMTSKPLFLHDMITFHKDQGSMKGTFNGEVFITFIKELYCPSSYDPDMLTFEEVRQVSVRGPKQKDHKPPTSWMPPRSALQQIAKLVQLQIDYCLTIGNHSAKLPNFIERSCLSKQSDGTVLYDFGPDSHVDSPNEILLMPNDAMLKKLKEAQQKKSRTSAKRSFDGTPQKAQRKRLLASTPKS